MKQLVKSLGALVFAAALFPGQLRAAEPYPTKTVRNVVGYSPGPAAARLL